MRLSTKGQYALEAMVAMTLADQDMLMSIRAIGQQTGISEPYLEQIFASLRRAGLIESVRGTRGGYRLAREPGRIFVGDVLRAGEGSLSPVRCTENGRESCGSFERCMTRPLWQEMSEAIRAVIDHQTLADIAAAWYSNQEQPKLDDMIWTHVR